MTLFSAMLDTLFASPLARDAEYFPAEGLPSLAVRILWKTPDEVFSGIGPGAVAPSRIAEIRASEAPCCAEGDSFVIGEETFTVARASKDRDGLLWRLEVE